MKDETQSKIGTLLSGSEERDAIHIAVMPVQAGEDYISPGAKLAFVYGSRTKVREADPIIYGEEWVGVADPFLATSVRKGQWFYMLLRPNTITGLTHHWCHPIVDNPETVDSESEAWLRAFAEKWHFDYNEMILVGTGYHPDKDWITAFGRDLHEAEEPGEDYDLFWHHLEKLTGRKFDPSHRKRVIWSCSC